MNKYASYIVFGCAAILWLGFMFGLFVCVNSLPEGFEPDDLHLACFGVGLFVLPYLAGLGYLSWRVGYYFGSK
ncbi:MAG: hypothetical protein J6Q53_00715 [Oscillospiraceae bacterium]|nr:hypothetical protein [Oscillospiraceae bacterium]